MVTTATLILILFISLSGSPIQSVDEQERQARKESHTGGRSEDPEEELTMTLLLAVNDKISKRLEPENGVEPL